MRLLILIFALSPTLALAQTGDAARGNTPPGMSTDGSGPADGALKGGSIVPGEKAGVPDKDSQTPSTEALKRCDELNGTLRQQCLELLQANVQGVRKSCLLSQHNLRYTIGGFLEFGVSILHQVAHREHHLIQEWLGLAEQTPVRDCPADDLSQHISPPFIGG